MLEDYSNLFTASHRQFECVNVIESVTTNSVVLNFRSKRKSETVACPLCGGKVHKHSKCHTKLKDMPISVGVLIEWQVETHRFRCKVCRHTFTEENNLRYPGTRITYRGAQWVQLLLKNHITIRAVQEITGFHWDTIKRIYAERMVNELAKRRQFLTTSGYKPKYLAVDEFAIQKGHRYATCVMDLTEGDVLWVGIGRTKECFRKFFTEFDLSYLSDVEAVAMDMNASYHSLVSLYLPHADIVYDRFHVQAQFGREVLGVVRLEEARLHRQKAKSLENSIMPLANKSSSKPSNLLIRQEKKLYTQLKSARWLLLSNADSLDPHKFDSLDRILKDHKNLALCYAMKEELRQIFELKDPDEARLRWLDWFAAAKQSQIPALANFALRKVKRLDGLVAHASHNISTGRLEGFNNKIKVAKRLGYGFRDYNYFFLLIRSLSIPPLNSPPHKKT